MKEATLERDKRLVQDHINGMSTKELKEKYHVTNVQNSFKNVGFNAREYKRQKFAVCRNHPDRQSHKAGRCIECHRAYMRKYNGTLRVFKDKPKPKIKEVYEPRELTPAEQRIRDKYRNITKFEIDKGISVRWYDLNITVRPKHL